MDWSKLKTFHERFAFLLGEERDREFSRRSDIGHKLVGLYRNGKGNPTLDNLEKLKKVYPESYVWLVTGEGSPYPDKASGREYTYKGKINFKEVPVVASVACGVAFENWDFENSKTKTRSDLGHLHNPFYVIAKGDSMRPYIDPKDWILCADIPLKEIKDKTAVVVSYKTEPDTTNANAKLFKRIDSKTFMLYSVNTKFDPTIHSYDEVEKIFKVVEVTKPVA